MIARMRSNLLDVEAIVGGPNSTQIFKKISCQGLFNYVSKYRGAVLQYPENSLHEHSIHVVGFWAAGL